MGFRKGERTRLPQLELPHDRQMLLFNRAGPLYTDGVQHFGKGKGDFVDMPKC